MKNTTEKKPNLLRRALAFLVTLVLVLAAVAAVAYRDKINFDALKRWYTYHSIAKNDSGQAESFSFEGRSDDLFSDLDGDLLVCSNSAVRIYSTGGAAYLNDSVELDQPALASGGGLAVAYDAGGRELRIFSKRSEAFSLTLEEGKSLLSATLSDGGWLTTTLKESGYKGVITVYNPSYEAVMSLRLSSRFLMDGMVTGNGRSLAALSVGQTDGAFESSLLFYHVDQGDEPYATVSLGNDVILSLDSDNAGLWALGESGLSVFSADGASLGQYGYDGRYLKNASLKGDGFAALLLGKYRSGNTAQLVTVGSNGRELGSLPISEQVLSFSASGKYLAVLTTDRLDIYTKDLTLYHTLEGTQGARSVLQRSDGSTILISDETARLYIPG